MPTDLLLPAFALTLIANFVLVAAAIYALRVRTARDEADRSADQARLAARRTATATEPDLREIRPITVDEPSRDVAGAQDPAPVPHPVLAESPAPPVESESQRGQPASGPVDGPSPDGPPKPARGRRATPPGGTTPKSPRGRRAAAPRPQPRPGPNEGNPRAETTNAAGASRRGGRRRFSLPPLDDDHERVNRSIETFFSGGDGLEARDPGRGPAAVATTVAAVAIDGIEQNRSGDDDAAREGVAAAVERTLRDAARADDRVTTTGPGRFRIVLPATGELAARAYLRRVRAAVEPSLESAPIPLGLLTATSTFLAESPDAAINQAEARLDASLASAASRGPGSRPRAAAD
jgi:GGDEF domain-containing protein